MQDKHHKGNHHQMIRAYFVLARYADSQYQIISRRMSSPDFQSKLLQLKSSKVCMSVLTPCLTVHDIILFKTRVDFK